ncbi:phosphatidylethanolamine-binding protein [Pleomassaria siparia CBS 279.74]|uniref:Phosphatidylethanolamine-binding protein n=1 Tax=Pleomassaria siparia CBS 279.74 TaxID=1314801 RepID=A0A6G1KSF6_9PLEO|nr:phosphatidylethanolamine-binding protein [Pleomassaria siparia CBS 279.74]
MTFNNLLDSLSSAKLLPSKVIAQDFKPSVELEVAFGSKKVENGNLLRVSDVKSTPSISFSADSSSTYTLLLVDPDAPTPDDPKFAYWRHWVVSGISSSGAFEKSALTEYLAPGVKDDSAPHRYTFLLYKEPTGLSLSKSDVGGEEFVDRRSFGVDEWVSKHGLKLVGVTWFSGAGDGWKA